MRLVTDSGGCRKPRERSSSEHCRRNSSDSCRRSSSERRESCSRQQAAAQQQAQLAALGVPQVGLGLGGFNQAARPKDWSEHVT